MSLIPTPQPVEPLWFPLVKKFYQSHYPSGKPNKSEPIWVIKNGAIILSAVRIKPLPDCQLLTALVTHPDHRQQGYASYLLKHIYEDLTSQPSYCFTLPELEAFYSRHGFIKIENLQLPDALARRLQRYQVKQPNLIAMKFSPSSLP